MKYRVLFALFVVALTVSYGTLYWRGLDFGRPFLLHPDERYIVDTSLAMAASGDYNPHFLEYSSLPLYVQLGLSCFTHLEMIASGEFKNEQNIPQEKSINNITARDTFQHYYVGRIWMAILAGIILVLVYYVSKDLLGEYAALYAVATMMYSSLFIEQAHYVTPNLYITLFALSALHCSMLYLKSGDLRLLYLAAVLTGLGIGCKYTIAVVLVPVLLAAVWRMRLRSLIHLVSLFSVASIVFLITTPFAVLDIPQFLKDLGNLSLQYKLVGVPGVDDTEQATSFSLYFLEMWSRGPFLLIMGIIGMVTLPLSPSRRRAALLLAFVIPYICVVLDSKIVYARNLTPLLPMRSIGASAVLYAIWALFSSKALFVRRILFMRRLAYVLCALVIAISLWHPFKRSVRVTKELTTLTAFQKADAWFSAKVPVSTKIAADHFMTCPAVPCADLNFDVQEFDTPHFYNPYLQYADYSILSSSGEDAYDGRDWRRERFFQVISSKTRPRDAKFIERHMTQNRRLAETRIPTSQIFDSEPPGWTEVLLTGSVTVSAIPHFEMQAFSTSKLLNTGTLATTYEALQNRIITVSAGEYDLFIEARQIEPANNVSWEMSPQATISVGSNVTRTTCGFMGRHLYYVTSFSATISTDLTISVQTPANCQVLNLTLARIGEPLGGLNTSDLVFFGENLIANSNFDRGFSRWNIGPPADDFAPSLSDYAAYGSRALAVNLAGSRNLGLSQDVISLTPGSSYVLTGYIACKNLAGTARLEAQDRKQGWRSFLQFTNGITGNEPWTRTSLEFILPDHVDSLSILLRRPAEKSHHTENGTIWFDCVRLHKIERA